MTEFPEIIKDGDIELRIVAPTFDNARELFDVIEKNRKYFSEYLGWVGHIQKPEDEFGQLQKWHNRKSNWLIHKDDKIIGSVGFANMEEGAKLVEIGYWMSAEFAGRGIMTRAVRVLEKMLFESGDWHRIEIRCDPTNIASRRIPEKLGYKLDGILRQEYPLNGELRDTMVWSKLEQEYK
jgi:ribosomal-protein-serine acetyltransferase